MQQNQVTDRTYRDHLDTRVWCAWPQDHRFKKHLAHSCSHRLPQPLKDVFETIYKCIKPNAHCCEYQGGWHLCFYPHYQRQAEWKTNGDSWSLVLVSRKRKQKGLVGKRRNQWWEYEEPKDRGFKMKGKQSEDKEEPRQSDTCYSPSTLEEKAERSEAQGHPWFHSECKVNLGWQRPWLRQKWEYEKATLNLMTLYFNLLYNESTLVLFAIFYIVQNIWFSVLG